MADAMMVGASPADDSLVDDIPVGDQACPERQHQGDVRQVGDQVFPAFPACRAFRHQAAWYPVVASMVGDLVYPAFRHQVVLCRGVLLTAGDPDGPVFRHLVAVYRADVLKVADQVCLACLHQAASCPVVV
ncbi:MAG: hypothetical protein AAF362_13255 [Pseudomonadota bacterium]